MNFEKTCEIIVIKYGIPEIENKCIKSIENNTDLKKYKLTIFDNFQKKINLGKLWNDLISKSDSEYICLLNSDTIVEPSWLDKLLEVFDEEVKVGIASSLTDNCAGIQSQFKKVSGYEAIHTDMLSGFCLVFPKNIWKEVGRVREDFGFYGQETEFALRVRELNKVLIIRKDVFIHHEGGASRKKAEERGEMTLKSDRIISKTIFDKLQQDKINIYIGYCLFSLINLNTNITKDEIIDKRKHYFLKTLDGIYKNTDNKYNYKVFVIDNSVTTTEKEILSKLQEQYSFRVIPGTDNALLIGWAYNEAVRNNESKWIVITDNDIVFNKEWLNNSFGLLNKYPQIKYLDLINWYQNDNIKVLKNTEDIQFVDSIHGAVLAERKNWLELGYQENDRFYNRGNIESLIVARSLKHFATHIGLMKCNGHMREW